MSIIWIYNELWWEIKVDFADISYQKPNIIQIQIDGEYIHLDIFKNLKGK
jgi:hypothetical protein